MTFLSLFTVNILNIFPNLPTALVSSYHTLWRDRGTLYPLSPLQVTLRNCKAQSVPPGGATAQQRGAAHVSTAVTSTLFLFKTKTDCLLWKKSMFYSKLVFLPQLQIINNNESSLTI